MRAPEPQTFYLVGTPKGRILQHERKWLDFPWQKVRYSVEHGVDMETGAVIAVTLRAVKALPQLFIKRRPKLVKLSRRIDRARSGADAAIQAAGFDEWDQRDRRR